MLTTKQREFARHKVDGLNNTEAALKAGYTVRSSPQVGTENMNKPVIVAEVARLRESRERRIEKSGDDVVKALWSLSVDSERDRLGALNTLAKIYGLTKEGLTINVDARNQVAALTDAQLAEALQAASEPALPLIGPEPGVE